MSTIKADLKAIQLDGFGEEFREEDIRKLLDPTVKDQDKIEMFNAHAPTNTIDAGSLKATISCLQKSVQVRDAPKPPRDPCSQPGAGPCDTDGPASR